MTEPRGNDALKAKRQASLARIDKLAYWLDDAFRIPVIGKRVGLDGLVGILPVAGDTVGLAMSSMLIGEAVRLNAPKSLLMRMGANAGIDFVIGSIPLLGDVFDIFFKANRRNQRLMQRWLSEVTDTPGPGPGGGHRRRGPGTTSIVIGTGAAVVAGVGIWRAIVGG